MIDLVLVYCLSAAPQRCVERRDPFESWGDPVACMMGAEIEAQQYLRDHPKWHLARWKCEVDVPRQDDT